MSGRRTLAAALLLVVASTLPATGPAYAGQGVAAPQPMPPLLRPAPPTAGDRVRVGVTQEVVADGTFATVSIAEPVVAPTASHSLASVAVRSADWRQNIQVGWTVDPSLNGDDQAHLFVIHRVDGVDACYNTCGFELYDASPAWPGDVLPSGTIKRFGIQHSGNRWWISYDAAWIGSFPDSLWGGTFVRMEAAQYFGEISATSYVSCSEMGSGTAANERLAARFSNILPKNPVVLSAPLVSDAKDEVYGPFPVSGNAFGFGGPARDTCDPVN